MYYRNVHFASLCCSPGIRDGAGGDAFSPATSPRSLHVNLTFFRIHNTSHHLMHNAFLVNFEASKNKSAYAKHNPSLFTTWARSTKSTLAEALRSFTDLKHTVETRRLRLPGMTDLAMNFSVSSPSQASSDTRPHRSFS